VTSNYKPKRGTIFVEEAKVLSHEAHAGDQHSMRLEAPRTAAHALPGQFVHLTCDPALPMRRPMSLMRIDSEAGCVDILFKVHGQGTTLLAHGVPGRAHETARSPAQPFRDHGLRGPVSV
jgi:dihydroorotate dehydrogenase electron transfer subunit